MGFISSLLCGSSDSDSSKKQKGKNSSSGGNSSKTSGGLSSEKSRSNNKGNSASPKKSPRPAAGATRSRQSEVHTTLSNSTAKMHLQKKTASNKRGSAEKVPSSKSRVVVRSTAEGNDTDSDVLDVAMTGEDEDDDAKGDEKQTLLVYNAESDTSTGTTTNTAVSGGGQTAPEATTIIREAEPTSSADDSEGVHSQAVSDVEMLNGEGDDGELLDLSQLQQDQAHAPGFDTLLLPKTEEFKGKKCLVLDLDETLVHSSFKYLRTADFVIPVEIDNQVHNVYVIKRPGVDEFLTRVSEIYEVVVFTASVSRYGDPLLDILDREKSIHHRLFRDSCYNYEGNYIKNLSQIGRPLSDMIILDNSPASYIFHPQHAIPISSWFSDAHDNELLDIIPLLEDLANRRVPDVGKILDVTI
ncbi:unnamed protein product [Kluyveromyces dobzhanskii CBS 2104]|uniref:WGS project CCBQ000000000 data, contig 00011 n=1 Tax=Kluyveromyces dobzhanskii CBS 2104 TaxID=1427455 RepID=A0A0A8L7A6_9SACH|nr:unnamed protein product [Kluyveromyces dobzhanskii CBS 2104]